MSAGDWLDLLMAVSILLLAIAGLILVGFSAAAWLGWIA